MSSDTIEPLANPKGVVRLCELCQKPAFVQCTQCRVTFYCDIDHQKIDWVGIHEKTCQLLIPLRTELPFVNTEEERRHRKQQQLMRQTHMVNLTRTTGQKLLFEGRHSEAIPAAMQSLRFAAELYGLASVELVPSYLILGRASIGLGKLDQAEDYLLQARWTVLKTPNCSNTTKHKLCRHLGLLYAAKKQFDMALRELADDIYHASEEFGTDHVRTSGGYFYMANIFSQQGNDAVANSLYGKVTDIWYAHLSLMLRSKTNDSAPSGPAATLWLTDAAALDTDNDLDEAQLAEGIQVLIVVLNLNERQSNDRPDLAVKTMHSLAMLYYVQHDIDKARDYSRKAVAASESVPDGQFSKTLADFLKVCENVRVFSQ